jgi:hypothetical protein
VILWIGSWRLMHAKRDISKKGSVSEEKTYMLKLSMDATLREGLYLKPIQ